MDKIKDEQIELNMLIEYLIKMRWLILFVTVVISGISILYTMVAKVQYQSASKIITKTSGQSQASNIAQLASLAGVNLGKTETNDPSKYLNIILQDRLFLQPFISKKWLYKGDSLTMAEVLNIIPDTTLKNWKYRFELSIYNELRDSKRINLTIDKNGLMTLTTQFETAELAYQVNEFLLSLIDDYIKNRLKNQATEKRIFIEERIKEVKGDLESIENKYVKFSESNISKTTPSMMLQNERYLRKIKVSEEVYMQLVKQYELVCLEEKNDQTLLEVIKNPEIPSTVSKPQRRLIITLGTIVGFGIAIGLILIIYWYKKTTEIR